MNQVWSLEELYHGWEDEKFLKDIQCFDQSIKELNDFAATKLSSKGASIEQQREVIRTGLLKLEKAVELENNLQIYCELRQSTDTTDSQSASYAGLINRKSSNMTKAYTKLKSYVAHIQDLAAVIGEDEILKEYQDLLEQMKETARYQRSEDVEEVMTKLNLSGGSAWSDLQSYLTSMVKVEYNKEVTTLSAIRNLAYSSNPSVRKAAYEAELACYEKIQDAVAFSLNSIKLQTITTAEIRGYESPLDMTLKRSRMKRETLEAMLTAIKEYLPKFHRYYIAKGKLLGYEHGLAWYDMFAPVGKVSRTYTTKEAKDYLLEQFEKFAPDLKEMAQRAFEEAWIDFFPHKGKVGGAFCCNIHTLKQSRVLTNFDGSFSDIVTIAHELGHAYHNQNIHSHRILNSDYTMPVAETASTFNETVVMKAAISAASGEERLALLESRLQDTAQIICDIYSRFLFESAVFEKRPEKFLFPDELCKLMHDAQKTAYGEGILEETLHPYMWICKSHYYSAGLSFYNFPYAFGGLFARGLYAQYEKEGKDFLPKYRKLLSSTPVCSVEDTAKVAGIDLTNPEFFRTGLESFAQEIEEFITLSISLNNTRLKSNK